MMKKILIGLAFALVASLSHAQLMYGVGFNAGGIIGSSTNDSATAGNIGEFKTTTVAAASAIAAANSTVSKNVTSVSLTAGDWMVTGTCDIVMTGLTMSVNQCGLGTTTDTLASQAGGSGIGTDPLSIITATNGTTLTGTTSSSAPMTRVSIAATTTIYLVANLTYSAGSATQYGTIKAWRVR
jgi:hypothetical protein